MSKGHGKGVPDPTQKAIAALTEDPGSFPALTWQLCNSTPTGPVDLFWSSGYQAHTRCTFIYVGSHTHKITFVKNLLSSRDNYRSMVVYLSGVHEALSFNSQYKTKQPVRQQGRLLLGLTI